MRREEEEAATAAVIGRRLRLLHRDHRRHHSIHNSAGAGLDAVGGTPPEVYTGAGGCHTGAAACAPDEVLVRWIWAQRLAQTEVYRRRPRTSIDGGARALAWCCCGQRWLQDRDSVILPSHTCAWPRRPQTTMDRSKAIVVVPFAPWKK